MPWSLPQSRAPGPMDDPVITAAGVVDAVAATLSPAEASGESWQVVVIGAGPAGAATAWRLASVGIRTLLVDRKEFPRTKVCGSCLSTRAIGELRDLGPDAMPAAAVPLEAMRLVHRGRSVLIPLPAGGRVVSRDVLDAHLVRGASAAGSHWLPGIRVSAIDEPGATAAVDVHVVSPADPDAGRHTIRAGMVVLATGLVDVVRVGRDRPTAAAPGRRVDPRSRVGLGGVLASNAMELPAGEVMMAVGRDGYCGIVRLADGQLDVAAALDRAALPMGPAGAIARLLHEAVPGGGCVVPAAHAIGTAAFRVTPPLTRRAAAVGGATRRIFRVGDAAGYVEPFTGEGIGWALASGRLLAEASIGVHGLRPPAEVADRSVAAWRRELASAHARCRAVAGALRRPAFVASAVAAARALPWIARRAVPLVIGTTVSGKSP